MKSRTKWLMIASLGLVTSLALGCAPAKAPPKAEVPAEYRSLRMVGASLGSAGTTSFMAFGTVLNKYLHDIEWSSSSGSTGTNAIYLTKGNIKLAQTTAANYVDAYGFDKVPESRLRSITSIFGLMHTVFLIPADKPWTDITQVPKGATIVPGSQGSNTMLVFDAWMQLAGLNKKDYNLTPLSMQGLADAWREGKVDLAMTSIAGVAPWLMDMHTSPRKFKPMGLTPEQVAKARSAQTFERIGADPPAMSILTQLVPEVFKNDVESVLQTPLLSARDDFPEDIAYRMARTFDEHSAELVGMYGPLKWATPQWHIKWARAPLEVHSGVAKYYKEKGYLK